MTATLDARAAVPVAPSAGELHPLALGDVRVTGGIWADLQQLVATATLPHLRNWQEREGWLQNFDLRAAGGPMTARRGREFSDSEVYKYLEAAAWEIGRRSDAELEAQFCAVVARVAAAQEPDGYLNTRFGGEDQPARWSDLEWGHELYCVGHLIQAAVARERTRPGADDGLLGVATRAADLVCTVFDVGGIESVCGHAEIEMALVELGRVTGHDRYLRQARLFVERRGHQVLRDIEWGRSYFQDDVPVRDADVLRGHAVRANFLAAGAADVAVETGDTELLDALVAQWERTVARRTYVTGGQGSQHQDEGFGDDWVLPPDRAYSETCAGVASIMFAWRLLLARGDARYADLVERTLYNVVATSLGDDGRSWFYANTLHRREPGHAAPAGEVSLRAGTSLRAAWYEVSCCLPNIARTVAALAAYVATTDDDGVQIHQYVPCTLDAAPLASGPIALDVATDYPRSGRVVVTVTRAPGDRTWTLSLRVPSWAAGATLTVTSGGVTERQDVAPGHARATRVFAVGDTVELAFPLEPRVTRPDPRIDAVRGTVAVERGPEVMALESVDLPAGVALETVAVDPASVRAVGDDVVADFVRAVPSDRPWPYGADVAASTPESFSAALVAYRDWAGRGPSTMRVWIPAQTL